jgi:hypothetical protein
MDDGSSELIGNPLVVVQATETGAVLIHMSTGDCFELNQVGIEVWRLLAEKRTLPEIVAEVARRHVVPEATVDADVRSLLAELTRHGLVTRTPR